jgi:hypothetical protein
MALYRAPFSTNVERVAPALAFAFANGFVAVNDVG